MRIAYLIHWNEGPESGVFKKVVAQASAWRALGHEVSLFLFSRKTAKLWNVADTAGISVVCEMYSGRWGRMARFKALAERLCSWQPDIIYHRFDLYYAKLPSLLRAFPSVLEINTNDVAELALERRGRGWLRYTYHRLTRGWVLRAAGGLVFVSRELAKAKVFRCYARRAIVIGNGIGLAEFPPLPAGSNNQSVHPEVSAQRQEGVSADDMGTGLAGLAGLKEKNDTGEAAGVAGSMRLVFIGSPGQPWQGLDEIAGWARAKPNWRFDIIGPEQDELEQLTNKRLPKRGAGSTLLADDGPEVPVNLFFHGILTRLEYQPLLDQADLAIGTLALYRKGMEEASPLKVREYLANGLPVIAAYKETDFPLSVPFILELPNKPGSAVHHLEEIEQFAARWKGRRVPRALVQHLDTTVKEAARVAYMERTLQEWRPKLPVCITWKGWMEQRPRQGEPTGVDTWERGKG
ncbi:glycosyltransferase [Paenibacillus sanguinis]|uniref:glycosyltransferase n=1 Tax=Paenibacillus sanguinis TaxID=225906 RepID=UPI0003700848|nr:glycosyltransferase [Paenibacillus sanguinis]